MFNYLIRRIFLAIPTMLAISMVTFALSRFAGTDPINIDYWEKPEAYRAKAHSMGLDQPLFYFTFTSLAFPDTLHRILPLNVREQLEILTRQSGNWHASWKYWQAVTTELDPDLENAPGTVLAALKNLRWMTSPERISEILKTAEKQVDTLQNAAFKERLKERLVTIKGHFTELSQEDQIWKLYVPVLYWHGLRNQYHQWLSGFLSGNPGFSSVTGNPLLTEVRPRLLITLVLNGVAMILAYLIAVPLGVMMARRHQRPFDRWMRLGLLFLHSMPVIWLGSLLILLLSRPDIGFGCINGLNAEPWLMSGKSFGAWAVDNREKFILPVLTLTLHTLAVLAMQMRGGILEVVKQDYIRTARAKGLNERLVYWRHAFRNALFPVITIFASFFPVVFSGSLVIEYLFDFPGMGIKMQAAFINNDYAVLFAMVMFVAFVTILGSIIADILYAWADPRVRFSGR